MKQTILVFILLFAGATAFAQEINPTEQAIITQTKKFRSILELAVKNHKDSVDVNKVSEAAYKAMLNAMDPYSDYFTEEVYKNFKASYYKVVRTTGIEVSSIKDTLFVIYVMPHSAADFAGIVPGDRLIYLNGKTAIGLKSKNAEEILTVSDSVVKAVNIVIKRYASPGLNEYFLMPKAMPIVSIPAYFMLPGTDIGYIKSKKFAEGADSTFRLALKSLLKQGAKKIIFDLRGHQGGQVKEAADIADEFIPEGETITYIKGENNNYYQKYISEPNDIGEGIPLLVLVDKNTMSAAEIFVGAVQDLDKAIIVGEGTYGKGMAQKTWSFKDGTAFRLTIGDYFTPTGRNIQKPHDSKNVELDPAMKLMMSDTSTREIKEMLERYNWKNKIPVFKTPKGRIVFGGGGILPDYFVKADTLTLLTRVLKGKGIFLESVFQYLNSHKDELLDKYGNDEQKFNKNFTVTDKMLNDLEKVSRSRNIWNEKMFQTDKEYIRNFYKSLIAYFLWGNDGFYLVISNKDNIIQKGIEYMPKAVELIK